MEAVLWGAALFLLLLTAILGIIYGVLKRRTLVKPVLHYKSSEWNDYLVTHCGGLTRPFSPPLYLSNRHSQTLLPTVISLFHDHGVRFERELITVEDGEKVALDWARSVDKSKKKASSRSIQHEEPANSHKDLIVILPGLTSGPNGFTSTCRLALDNGFDVAVLSKRGHAGSRLSKPVLRGFGDGSDLHCVLKVLKERNVGVKIAVLGSSAGTAVANAYIGEYKNSALIDASVNVSAGFAVEKMFSQPPYSKFYEFLMVENIKRRTLHPNKELLSEIIDLETIKRARTLYDIEEQIYCKSYGYSNMAEYWSKNEPKFVNCNIPRLFFNSMDDPICVPDLIPFDSFNYYENCILMALDKGGHCGFLEDMSGFHYVDKVGIDFIKVVFNRLEEQEKERGVNEQTVYTLQEQMSSRI